MSLGIRRSGHASQEPVQPNRRAHSYGLTPKAISGEKPPLRSRDRAAQTAGSTKSRRQSPSPNSQRMRRAWAVTSSVRPVTSFHVGHVELHALELCVGEINAIRDAVGHDRAAQIGAFEVCPAQCGSLEIYLAQIRAAQIGPRPSSHGVDPRLSDLPPACPRRPGGRCANPLPADPCQPAWRPRNPHDSGPPPPASRRKNPQHGSGLLASSSRSCRDSTDRAWPDPRPSNWPSPLLPETTPP